MATARFLERVVAQRPMPVRMVVASSMSIYGEGEYVCEEHGRVAPRPAPRGAAARPRVGDGVPVLRTRAQAASAPARPSRSSRPRSTRSTSATTRRWSSSPARPTGSPPSPCASSTSTAPARRSRTRTPASRRSSPRACSTAARRSSSRTASSRATSRTSRTSSRASCSRSSPTARRGPRGQPRHRPPDLGRPGGAGHLGRHGPRHRARVLNQQYRAGDIRHCFADPTRARELLGFEAATTVRGRHERARRVAAGPGGRATRSTTPPRSWPRAAWPASEHPSDHRDRTHRRPGRRRHHHRLDQRGEVAGAGAEHRLRPRGRCQARRRRRRQRVDRRHARARRVEVPGRPRGRLPEQGLRPRQQPRRGDVRRALRPLPQSRHGDRRRDLRRAGRGARRAAGRGDGGGPAAHRRRHPVADHPLLPERPARPGRGLRVRALDARGRGGPASASSTSPSTRPRSSATGPRGRSCSAGARRC